MRLKRKKSNAKKHLVYVEQRESAFEKFMGQKYSIHVLLLTATCLTLLFSFDTATFIVTVAYTVQVVAR